MASSPAIVSGERLCKRYGARSGRLFGAGPGQLAVEDVTFCLAAGEVVGLVGRSGAGKSTLARLLLGLEGADSGTVSILGEPLEGLPQRRMRQLRRFVQAVFQDPFSSLDPRQRVGPIIAEPLVIHHLAEGCELSSRTAELLDLVGLPSSSEFRHKLPAELSGGERQRVAIARALATGPRALVLDEPVSALDASVRGQVLNVLIELHQSLGLAMLVVAHDLYLVARLCDRLVVMAEGRIVEEGDAEDVLRRPTSPETQALVRACPEREPRSQ
jgi:ABC-type glutathione transport system ATPase component